MRPSYWSLSHWEEMARQELEMLVIYDDPIIRYAKKEGSAAQLEWPDCVPL